MRAQVYVLQKRGEWSAWLTLSPEVDYAYWFGEGSAWEAAECAWLWREELPLGQASEAVELWRERVESKHFGRVKQGLGARYGGMEGQRYSGATMNEAKAVALMSGIIEEVRAAGERRKHAFASKRASDTTGGVSSSIEGMEQRSIERWREGEGQRVMAPERWSHVAAASKLAAELLQGRALLSGEARELLGAGGPGAAASWREAIQLAALLGRVRLRGAVAADGGGRPDARRRLRCRRCGSGEARLLRSRCLACGRECAYCEACLTMGRSRECELLIEGVYTPQAQRAWMGGCGQGGAPQVAEAPTAPVAGAGLLARWGLSPAQQAATEEALRFVEERDRHRGSPASKTGRARSRVGMPSQQGGIRSFLLWAVTGAGKTEMVFPLVESVLRRGGRALIASPRRDVVLELDPRIRSAFPHASVVTLYGGSEQRWERGDITLSTTHQLFRFHHAFDLVILDEIDAFPYHGDPLLQYAADKSCLPGAPRLLLSATPPRELQRAAKRGELAHARVPVRYHRHPLPVPALKSSPSVHAMLASGRLPAALRKAIQASLERGAQLFLFVQRIAHAEPLAVLLREKLRLPQELVAATSSQDPARAAKVAAFRSADIRILVTTTILERGVTIPRSDVMIMDADGRLFDEASLVQMAGRAGRSAADPGGKVYFVAPQRTQSQLHAVRHIRAMNALARAKGYLLPKS
ncbi:helicase-related protein [Paenibacillus sp. PL2-23]|uniref:DEAD/DEAH box helicase n=1 Tax=Paenibacillus sp. PL2-23 TaxID=2100729 RepID=UPI0030F7F20C